MPITNDTARAILDDLFKLGDDPIIRGGARGDWCFCCHPRLGERFETLDHQHKPDCPYARYRRMVEEER